MKTVILETLRRNLRSLYYRAFFGVTIAMAAVLTWAFGSPQSGGFAYLGMFLAAQILGPEISSGSIQIVLMRPVGRAQYLLGRFIGVFLAAMILYWAASLTALAVAVGRGGDVVVSDHLVRALSGATQIAFIMALLVLFSTFARSYFNVVLLLLYMMLIVPLNAWLGIHAPAISRMVMKNLFAHISPYAGGDYLLVLSNTLIVLLLSAVVLSRRQFPYGAD